MIKHGLLPNVRGAVSPDQIFQPVRAKRTEHHGQQSRRRRDARSRGGIHFGPAAAAARSRSERSRYVSSGAVAHAVYQRLPSSWPLLTSWAFRKASPSEVSPSPESLPSFSNLYNGSTSLLLATTKSTDVRKMPLGSDAAAIFSAG